MASRTVTPMRNESPTQRRARLIAEARDHIERDRRSKYQDAIVGLMADPPSDPEQVLELGCLLAYGGRLQDGLRRVEGLADPAATAAVISAAADAALRRQTNADLPPDLHPGFDAVTVAFAAYEAGNDDAARTALEPIGLRSPFLEWKVLLRGLIAFSTNDDAKAIENWQRLDPRRLPFRLAAVIRAQIDPAFRSARSADTALLAHQYRALTAHPLLGVLENLRAELSRDRPLTAAFRQYESSLQTIRQHCNLSMQAKLAQAFYRAIFDHGLPNDLPTYRRLFGPPPDDPEFARISAMALERCGDWAQANEAWSSYETWLHRNPQKWPADVTQRGRALILHRMGTNAVEHSLDVEAGFDIASYVDELFGQSRRRGGHAQLERRPSRPANPIPLFRKAAELAPDWPEPTRELINLLVEAGKLSEAEETARRLLEGNPNAAPVLEGLAVALMATGRAADALELRLKALAINPLDKKSRLMTGYSHLAVSRKHLIAGDPAVALAALDQARDPCEQETPTGFHALRSVCLRKLGRKDEADAARDAALAVPGGRLAAIYFLATDAALAKLKPADKRPADQALAAAWAGPSQPREANLLYAAWDQYPMEGVKYRGQPTHEKKIHAIYLTACDGNGAEIDFELMAESLAKRHEWKVCAKVAGKLLGRWPTNPVFPFLMAEAEYEVRQRPSAAIFKLIELARRLAEHSTEPRHRAVLDRVNEFARQAFPGTGMLEYLFDEKR